MINELQFEMFEEYESIDFTDTPIVLPSITDFFSVFGAARSGSVEKLWLCLMFLCLARKEEIEKMRWSDVSIDCQGVVLHGKYCKSFGDFVELYDDTKFQFGLFADGLDRLEHHGDVSLIANPHDDGFIFASDEGCEYRFDLCESFSSLCHDAGVLPFNMYSIRAIGVWYLLAKKTPLYAIQKMLRHKDIGTTKSFINRMRLAENPYVSFSE